jgi:N6-adenosine-specific RNA methylase IME4
MDTKTAEQRARRDEREQRLASKIKALPDKRYGVILADPEWRFEVYSRETGLGRAADNHYPTSALEIIKSRPVDSIAAKHAVLYLWTTSPMLANSLDVMKAWGFAYKAHCVWVKDRIGTGYWFRNRHELLLVGTKGDTVAPAPGTQWPSVIEAARMAHSAKPEIVLEMIEALYPNIPKIELNRRGAPRPGWDAWGNEVET